MSSLELQLKNTLLLDLYQNLCFNGSTPLFAENGDGGSGFAGAAASASGFDFGVDPNIDPELALALRVSMEEERARQEAAAKKAAEDAARQENVEEPASRADDATMIDHVNVSAPEENKKTTDSAVDVSSTSIVDICLCVQP